MLPYPRKQRITCGRGRSRTPAPYPTVAPAKGGEAGHSATRWARIAAATGETSGIPGDSSYVGALASSEVTTAEAAPVLTGEHIPVRRSSAARDAEAPTQPPILS